MKRRQFLSRTIGASALSLYRIPVIQAGSNSSSISDKIRQWKGNPIKIGDRKQLFIDKKFIAASHGVELITNPPLSTRQIEMPLLNGMASSGGYSTVLDVEGEYWFYYHARPEHSSQKGHQAYMLCLSKSEDGIHWRPAEVNRFKVDGSQRNNIVAPGAIGTVFIDPKKTLDSRYWFLGTLGEREEPPIWEAAKDTYYRRYYKEGHAYHEGGIYLLHSTDGMAWNRLPDVALPLWCDTQNQCLYDQRIDKYVAYLRGNNPAGMKKRRNVRRIEVDRLDKAPWPYDENPNRKRGPNGLFGNLIDELPEVMGANGLDPDATDIYTPCVNPYPWADDAYFAFPAVYRHYDGQNSYGRDLRGKYSNHGPVEVQLAVSRNGIEFTRFRRPYLASGLLDEDKGGGDVYMGVGMIKRGNFVYHYFHEDTFPHGPTTYPYRESFSSKGMEVAIHRLDGFVSIDAGPSGGELVTPPIQFEGNRLNLNIDCGAMGEAWVEIQDAHARPISGYSFNESVSVDRNGIAQEVWWQKGPDVSELAGQPIRLHVKMRSAKLFAFQFIKS